MKQEPDPYRVDAAVRVLDVLDLFRSGGEEITLPKVVERLGMVKSTAFRMLYTLEQKRYIERVPGGRGYRRRRRHRIGFASVSSVVPFAVEVNQGMAAAAAEFDTELLVASNEFDAQRTIRNVDEFLRAGIELLIEYNTDEHVSHIIADRCSRAGVPVIGITFPVPGGATFGINNYRAGLTGGEGIGQHVAAAWKGRVDAIVLLDILGASPAQQARMTGMLEGLRKFVPVSGIETLYLHTNRLRADAGQLIRSFLDTHPRSRRILILSFNDDNALRALSAIKEAGRSRHVLMLSQGGVTAAREELRRPGSPLWGAVAHFPERFGAALMPVAIRILRGEHVPNTVSVEHVLLTRSNLEQYYAVRGLA